MKTCCTRSEYPSGSASGNSDAEVDVGEPVGITTYEGVFTWDELKQLEVGVNAVNVTCWLHCDIMTIQFYFACATGPRKRAAPTLQRR